MQILLHPAQWKLGLIVSVLDLLPFRKQERRDLGHAIKSVKNRPSLQPEAFTQCGCFRERRHPGAEQQVDD